MLSDFLYEFIRRSIQRQISIKNVIEIDNKSIIAAIS